MLKTKVAYGKEHGENPASNQNASILKDSELYHADVEVEMGKLEYHPQIPCFISWTASGETDVVGCSQCQPASKGR